MKLLHAHARREGQTIIEAIVALGILTVGFLGIVTLLSHSFSELRTTANETTATYLAAEGLELTKNILDHGMYTGDWPCFPADISSYEFDYTILATPDSACSSLSSDKYKGTFLTLDPSTGLYGYWSGSGVIQTDFTREISITYAPDGKEAIVHSIVQRWSGILGTLRVVNTVDLKAHFYDWHP